MLVKEKTRWAFFQIQVTHSNQRSRRDNTIYFHAMKLGQPCYLKYKSFTQRLLKKIFSDKYDLSRRYYYQAITIVL